MKWSGKGWYSQRLPLCFHFLQRGLLLGSGLWVCLPAITSIFIPMADSPGYQSSGTQRRQITKGQKARAGIRKWTSLETTTMGPGLPSCTPGYGFPKPVETLGYQGLGHCQVITAAFIWRWQAEQACQRGKPLNSGPNRRTAGTLVGVGACRRLDASSQPEKIPQDFQLSFLVSNNEQGEPQTVVKIAHTLPQTCLAWVCGRLRGKSHI